MQTHRYLPTLQILRAHDVEFIVVGGLAGVLQGAPIVTFDIDILHRRTPENVKRLLAALSVLDAVYRDDPRRISPSESHLMGPGHQLLVTKLAQLDVLGSLDDRYRYEDLLELTVELDLGPEAGKIRILELSRLIQAKEFAGRPKDLAVLPVLRATLDEIRKREPTR